VASDGVSQGWERLRGAWQRLDSVWNETSAVWRDGIAKSFEADYIRPVGTQILATEKVLEDLGHVITRAHANVP
jgi:hypothetical protein